MAENAFEYFIVVRINVTIGANVPFSLMTAGINREIEIVMIPGSLIPTAGIVTILTSGRESGGLMIGIGGIVVIILMTGKTVCRGVIVA